ncbi:MAG: DegT/DnrJ/EryC1/StrS family aminotransferase [Myxococcaceae bacterium]|nr:DegT/DnrJ/EryC1/StrS family aminotransferase [Myxococcaceae bacterium]
MIPNVKPTIPEADIPLILRDIKEILLSRQLVLGRNLREFESAFKDYVGTAHALGTSSCSQTLQMLFQYFGVEDREVILPTLNFISAANAVLWAGGTPVFCDNGKGSLLPTLETIEASRTGHTAGLVLVHITGHINPELAAIKEYCKREGLFLLEDCSHAHGSRIDGVKAGALCDAAVFSMFATKVITTGTGGMLTTNDSRIAEYVLSARHQGQGRDLTDCSTIGGGWHMTEMAAVLGRYQLGHLEEWVTRRGELAQVYDRAFARHPKLQLLKPVGRSAYYKYQVLLSPEVDRQWLVARLGELNVQCGAVYHPPIHLQPVYQRKFNFRAGTYPNAEDVARRVVALPMFVEMTAAEQQTVIDAVLGVLR